MELNGIYRAAIEIAYDNGGVNRDRTEDDVKKDALSVVSGQMEGIQHAGLRTSYICTVMDIDKWLLQQPDDVLETVCAGEDADRLAALVGAPHGTDALLNAIFENAP